MKALRIIHRIALIAGFITGLSFLDGITTSFKDMWTGLIIISLVMIQVIYIQLTKENHKEEKI